jgi:hypothetical protein
MASTTVETGQRAELRDEVVAGARDLAAVTLVAALCGMFVVGVLARLAMMLLAVLNPENAGVRSDDGFTIGQFTLAGSLQLLASGLQLGVTGALFYLVLRGLMVGPAWFRLLSISLGPAVVVGAFVVHTDGVDFTVLQPRLLAVALFVLLPGIFAALLHLGAERALRSGRPLPGPLVALGLLPWLVLLPVTLLLLGGFLLLRFVRGLSGGRAALVWAGWAVRAGLAALFVYAVVDLVRDARYLSGLPG